MARDKNFLLGRGELLASEVVVKRKVDTKNPPYTFTKAKERIAERVTRATKMFASLPEAACPGGRVVAVVTLHPRYISKSEFPEPLFRAVGMQALGSRLRTVRPESWGIEEPPEEAPGEDIFVSGTRGAFNRWSSDLPNWTEAHQGASFLQTIEDLDAFRGPDKVQSLAASGDEGIFEVVLHNAGDPRILRSFARYAKDLGLDALVSREKSIRGLTFVPVRGPTRQVSNLADFSFVRVVRSMPSLRPIAPPITRTSDAPGAKLPSEPAIDPSTKVLIFDGGIPSAVDLGQWVRVIEPPGIGAPKPEYEDHGLAVTSAFLFGPISDDQSLERPLCKVDHVRVLDVAADGSDLEYIDVLERVDDFLAKHLREYRYIGISLGPRLPVDDDDVTQWTACLDEHLAGAGTLALVAAGNDGEQDGALGMNRIQPPADAVNVLSVGACDRRGKQWRRSSYSCIGPGRTPGLVKRDGVAFGGSLEEPFGYLARDLVIQRGRGTSLAVPFALRSAVAVGAQLGDDVDPLCIRALMIHRAEEGVVEGAGRREIGWGRFTADFNELITCDDDEAVTIFRGTLPVGKHLRVPVPLRNVPLTGKVNISATLVISPEVDPEHTGAYTRSGVLPCFRPHSQKYSVNDGKVSKHPKSEPFFSARNMYASAEYELRMDGQKWEPVLRARRGKYSSSLNEPIFDFQYQHREGLSTDAQPRPIPYALIVGIRAPRVADLYNRVVRAYPNVLVQIRPKLRIPVRV